MTEMAQNSQNPLDSQESLVEEIHSPRKAVVFDGSPETTLDDYLASVSKTIDPENITHAAEIRGDRVCMFFREENDIKRLLTEGGLDVKNSFAQCQRFHAEPSKVILSNCLPFISNKKLVKTLSRIGKIASPITDVFANTTLDTFKHVKSFRKSVYIWFPDLENVPYKVMVEYRTKRVPIYICVEDLLCVNCKSYGHCTAHCPLLEAVSARPQMLLSTEAEERERPRTKSVPARRFSSPITSFFCRHAADLSKDPGVTSSIDFSRESVWSISPKVASIDDVLNVPVPSGSNENSDVLKRESARPALEKTMEEAIYDKGEPRTDPHLRTFRTFSALTSDCRMRSEVPPLRRIAGNEAINDKTH